MRLFSIILFLSLVFVGCEEVKVQLPDETVNATQKVVLIEEVTGVGCSNCPRAAKRLEEIAEKYPDNVVILGVHGDQQTEPYKDSKYDFRTEDGSILENYLRPFLGKPAASFDRTQFADEDFLSISAITKFQSKVEELIQQEPIVSIESSHTFDATTRVLTLNAGIKALIDLSDEYFVTVAITENGLVDYQLDADFGGYNPDYVHNHVLRDVITNVTGDALAGLTQKGDLVSKQWKYTIPTEWNMENLDVVIFVSNRSNDTKNILQANKSKI